MILKCKVVFFFLCILILCTGQVQGGDIEVELSTLTKTVENLKKFPVADLTKHRDDIQTISLNVLKLINEGAEISEKMPTLTIAEMIYYQTFDEGAKGLGYYVELEAIKNENLKKNVIPILAQINYEQQQGSQSTARLYEKLSNIASSIIQNREELEIEGYFKDQQGALEYILPTLNKIKTKDMERLHKKVLLSYLKQSKEIQKIEYSLSYFRNKNNNEDIVRDLQELFKEVLINMPISEAMIKVELLDSENDRMLGYEKLLENIKGDDLLQVIDAIFYKDKIYLTKLRQKIPYDDEKLKEMVKNSTTSFKSPKLRAIRIRSYLKNDPNDQKILEMGLVLTSRITKWHEDFEFIQQTVKMLPSSIRAIINDSGICLTNEGRYLNYDNLNNVAVTESNGEKTKTSVWNLNRNFDGDFHIICKATSSLGHILNSTPEKKINVVNLQRISDPYPKWTLNFTDSYTKVKIGNGEKYLKIEESNVILDDIATTWDFVAC